MKAHIQERLNQFHSNLEKIRAEHPRPESVSDFSFTTNDDYSMYYDEFIENLKEAFASSGPSSDKMNAISDAILTKFEEVKAIIDEENANYSKEITVYQGDILRKKEEDDFLIFLKQEVTPLGFDRILRVGKRAIPDEVYATYPAVYEVLGFTHIQREEWRDFVFYNSKNYDKKLSHIFESKYRELGGVPFHNLTGHIQEESIQKTIDKLLLILESELK